MIEKRNTSSDSQFHLMTSASQFSNRGANENKRATMFYNLRENSAGGLEQLLESKNTNMSVIIESNEGGFPFPTSTQNQKFSPQGNPYRMPGQVVSGQENLESTPRLQMQIAPGMQNTATRAS